MSSFRKQKIFVRRATWVLASLLLSGCEVGSATKGQQPYRAPSSGLTGISTSSSSAEVGSWLTVNVSVNDKNGYGIPNVVPTVTAVNNFSLSSTGVSSGGCSSTNIHGTAQCTLRATSAGDYTVSVVTPVQAKLNTPVTFYQLPRALGFTTQPTAVGTKSLAAFAAQPVVTVYDALGFRIPNGVKSGSAGANSVSLLLNSTTAGVLLPTSNPSAAVDASGDAHFSLLNVDLIGSYTLTATLTDAGGSGTITATSASFQIVAGAATKFHFRTSPSSTTNAVTFGTPPVVVEQDALGNDVLTDSSCVIALSLNGPNLGDQLVGNVLSTKLIAGVGSFATANLRVLRNGVGTSADSYTLTATGTASCAGALNGATAVSNSFNVSLAGLPSQLTVVQSPETSSLNSVWVQQPVVHVLDIDGNLVATDSTTVVVMDIFDFVPTVGGGTRGALVGSTSVQASGGIATFSGLSVPAAVTDTGFAGTYTYRFRGFNGSISIAQATTTQLLNKNGLVPAAIQFKVQPVGGAAAGQSVPQILVQVVDANGFLCAFDQASVVNLAGASITGPAGGVMNGTNLVTVVNGVAVFNGMSFTKPGAWQLHPNGTSGATPLPTINSNIFLINSHGTTADHLKFTTMPAKGAGGAVWATQPVVAVQDSAGNTMTDDNTTIVTIDCAFPTACVGKLLGNTSKRVTNGVADFAGANIHLVGGAWGAGAVPLEVVQATGSPALPVAPNFSNSFDEN